MAQWPVWRLAGAGLTPVKVNPVLMRGVNDDQAAELLRFCGSPGRCDRGSGARDLRLSRC
jgi:hypothetical protein